MERVNCIELSMWRLAILCMLLILTKSSLTTERNHIGSSSSDDGIITILSIDGGGIRGMFPATILAELESMLQALDGDDVSIVDYFDMIGGTSTGAIIGGFLTVPNEKGRPLYSVKDIINFYYDKCGDLFWKDPNLNYEQQFLRRLGEPQYNETVHIEMMKDLFGGIHMHETLTNMVVPTYDTKLLNPIIFTSSKGKIDESMDALLSDVIIGTSSPPPYYPPYYFNICTSHQVCREFNLYDGAVVANNPTLVSLTEMIKEVKESMGHIVDYRRFRILSLGTGTRKEVGFEAKDGNWGIMDFYNVSHVFDEDYTSLNSLISGSANDLMVELYTHLLLHSSSTSPNNYLRIQVDTLSSSEANFANGTKTNLLQLGETAQEVLNRNLTSFDPSTCRFVPDPTGGTTREALLKFANELSVERKRRLSSVKLSKEI